MPFIYDSNCNLVSDTAQVVGRKNTLIADDNKSYDEQIICTNKTVIKIINLLKKLNYYNDSIIVITSDHSATVGISGMESISGHTHITENERDIINKHQKEFNDLLDKRAGIPLWIKFPNSSKKLHYDNRLVLSLDIAPTLLNSAA